MKNACALLETLDRTGNQYPDCHLKANPDTFYKDVLLKLGAVLFVSLDTCFTFSGFLDGFKFPEYIFPMTQALVRGTASVLSSAATSLSSVHSIRMVGWSRRRINWKVFLSDVRL